MSMFRLRYTLVLVLAGFAMPAFASDEAKHGDKGHGQPPIYEVIGEDHDGAHKVWRFDLSKPSELAEFRRVVEHEHVHEVVNKTPPAINKMASLRYDLGIWTVVIFLLFFFFASKFIWPKVLTAFQSRADAIEQGLSEAEKARNEAKALMADLAKERAEAADKVKAIIDEAKRDAQTTADDLLTKARADITTERERLKREIQIEVDQAMQSLWTKTASLATQVAGKAIRKQFDGDQQRRLIDEAVAELRKTSV